MIERAREITSFQSVCFWLEKTVDDLGSMEKSIKSCAGKEELSCGSPILAKLKKSYSTGNAVFQRRMEVLEKYFLFVVV